MTWELRITRKSVQRRASDGRVRTVGTYAVFVNGKPAPGYHMTGMTAESAGPSANAPARNGKRIEPGRYGLATQAGAKYVTLGYKQSLAPSLYPKPGIELLDTGKRSEILIHPGVGFLASVGCINLCRNLPDASEPINYVLSRERVIVVIASLVEYCGEAFPRRNGQIIPDAFVVIDGGKIG